MIGYHYTTKKLWEGRIRREGLQPRPIRQHGYECFRADLPRLPRDAVWVWQEPLSSLQAFISLVLLGSIHKSFDLVLLEVVYANSDAASIIYNEHRDGTEVQLFCTFEAEDLSTGKQPIELLVNPIEPKKLALIWEGDLLSCLNDRHHKIRENHGLL